MQAMSHRFCVVSPGDTFGTRKITETLALGGAGGCVPLIFVPGSGSPAELGAMLPYTRWLDYCRVAYLIPERETSRRRLPLLLARLARVTADEVAPKRRALRAVRRAFVFSKGSSPAQPSATDYMLADACSAARVLARETAMGGAGGDGILPAAIPANEMPRLAGGDHARCTLQTYPTSITHNTGSPALP